MKMLMSADSSDCRANHSGSDCDESPAQSPQPAPTTTTIACSSSNNNNNNKTSVICLNNIGNIKTELPTTSTAAAAAAAAANKKQPATTTPQSSAQQSTPIGRSHLENALKLPANTSVASYYQNTNLQGMSSSSSSTSSSSTTTSATTTTPTPHIVGVLQQQQQQQQTPSSPTSSSPSSSSSSSTSSSSLSASASSAPTACVIFQAPADYQQPQQQQQRNTTTKYAPSQHGNVIFINKTTCNISNNTVVVQNGIGGGVNGSPPATTTKMKSSTTSSSSSSSINAVSSALMPFVAPPPPPLPPPPASSTTSTLPQQHGVVSTSDFQSEHQHHQHQAHHATSQQLQLYQQHVVAPQHQHQHQHPQQYHQQYHHHHHQQHQQHHHQHQHGVGTVVVVAADSRPQTPDYIKSYPVMDTTVASSVKGEPELNIEFDGTTVLCRVCGDKASGFHYGVHSCEGCKGFFRRSIQQKIQYRPCTKNQQCSILRINRNRCQYCRLKKCIAVGMSRDAVRFGRVPKREKARILAAMQQSTQNRGQQRQLATELDDQPRLLAAVLRAHLETCEFTKEKVAAMRQRARECPSYSMPTLLACPLNPAPELQSEQEFSQRFAHVIRGVIDFAGMIPGFQLLTQDDKFTLLKAGLFDALFVRLICMFDSSINSIICLNGQVMRRDAIQNGANARFLVDSTFNFAERMNSMNLSDAEIGLFCAIVLITPDRPGLRNIELIEKMYSRLKGCLQTIINQNRPEQPEFLAKLLETMPDLRTLSTLHTEKLVVFRTEHKELLRQQMWSMDDADVQQPASNANSTTTIINGSGTKSPTSTSSATATTAAASTTSIWDEQQRMMDVENAKSPLGSVSSTESGDMDYTTTSTTTTTHHHLQHQHQQLQQHLQQQQPHNLLHQHQQQQYQQQLAHHHQQHQQQPSALASSAPLLAATLSGGCPLRNRANSGSSGDSAADLDMVVGSHAHLTQNGLTITPIVRAAHTHSAANSASASTAATHQHHHQQQQQQLHRHLTTAAAAAAAVVGQRYRKLDSPTDSGIESGNEKNECGKPVSSGGSSSCSSPRSSVDDALDCSDAAHTAAAAAAAAASSSQQVVTVSVSVSPVRSPQPTSSTSASAAATHSPSALKRQIVDDMPVLKRVLQAPPLYDTNSLMDEAYKPHKKFRALRHREYETAEADASSTTNAATTSTSVAATNSASPPPAAAAAAATQPPTASPGAAATAAPVVAVPQASISPNHGAVSPISNQPHHQSQLHMHLTRPTPTNQHHQQQQQQQQSASSLSSTHSVLAKSLMAEPRMTPEQIKRSDIIQNYIMRETAASSAAATSTTTNGNGLMVHTPNGPGSRSPAPPAHHHYQLHHHHHNSNCASPSTTTVTLASPPPPPAAGSNGSSNNAAARWPTVGHSVITTTSINQRQPSVSPSSNGSSSSNGSASSLSSALSLSLSSSTASASSPLANGASCSASSSSTATSTTGGVQQQASSTTQNPTLSSSTSSSSSSSSSSSCQYFQSPHSTSASVSPPRQSPSTTPQQRLLELQVEIADSQQPLNLSKKSPTPPPSKLHALVAAATAAQRYSADVTVTTAANNGGHSHSSSNSSSAVVTAPGNAASSSQNVQIHKVMLEA